MATDFFVQVLSDFINGNQTEIPQELNIEKLYEYGKKHEVLGILYYQTKLPRFLSGYSSTLYANINRKEQLKKITQQLECPYFIVKGFEAAAQYPVPELRTMGDVDLVVHSENREAVHELLLSLGYNNTSKQQEREWQYYRNGMELELHDRLIYEETVNDPRQAEFFNDYWKYVADNSLDWSFHFLFLVSHLRKHFMNEGVGFRQFMDITMVAKNAGLNWAWVEENANKIGLLPFLQVVLAFCSRWFGLTVPVAVASIEEVFFQSATRKILEDGVFGFGNEENKGSMAINLYRKNGFWGMLGNALRQVFPSYKALCAVPKYSFLKGKPYLLPFAWILRAINGRRKSRQVMNEVKNSFCRIRTDQRKRTDVSPVGTVSERNLDQSLAGGLVTGE